MGSFYKKKKEFRMPRKFYCESLGDAMVPLDSHKYAPPNLTLDLPKECGT